MIALRWVVGVFCSEMILLFLAAVVTDASNLKESLEAWGGIHILLLAFAVIMGIFVGLGWAIDG